MLCFSSSAGAMTAGWWFILKEMIIMVEKGRERYMSDILNYSLTRSMDLYLAVHNTTVKIKICHGGKAC